MAWWRWGVRRQPLGDRRQRIGGSQAEVEQGVVTSIATVQYLSLGDPGDRIWGPCSGLAGGMTMAVSAEESTQAFLDSGYPAPGHRLRLYVRGAVPAQPGGDVLLADDQREEERRRWMPTVGQEEHLVLRLYDRLPKRCGATQGGRSLEAYGL